MNTGAGDGLGGRNTSSSFLRVISLSIALYDYILTLPAEWRFYRSQPSWRLSLGCILFIAIRYSSIAVITLSNVGYFASFFTPQSCERYYIAAPIFKVLQTMVSQLILGIRTINISRRSTVVTWFLASIFLTFTTAQWFLNMWNRVPVQGRLNNCTAGNTPPVLTVWLYYLLSMAYDILTLGISTAYLISFNPKSGKMAHLVRIMLTDGLVYFVALTGVNIFNLILYRGHDEATQSSGVSLGYALTWIMSQRILIHLRDAAAAHNRTVTTQLVITHALPPSGAAASHSAVARALRSLSRHRSLSRSRAHERSGPNLAWRADSKRGAGEATVTVTALSTGFDVELSDGGDVDWAYGVGPREHEREREHAARGVRDEERGLGRAREGDRNVVAVSVERVRGRERERERGGCSCSCSCGSASGSGSSSGSWSAPTLEEGSPRGPPLPSENATRSAFSADYDADADDDADVGDDDKWAGDEEKGEREEVSDLRVRIEETVTVEVAYDSAAHTRETYRAPRVLWAMRSGSAVGAGGGAGRSAQSSAARGTRGERGERDGEAGTGDG